MTYEEALSIMADLIGINPKQAEALYTITKLVESIPSKELSQLRADIINILHKAEDKRYNLICTDSDNLTEVLLQLNKALGIPITFLHF